jgi:hypothetical protein
VIADYVALEAMAAKNGQSFCTLHLVFGVDRGQGAFRGGLQLILRGPDGSYKKFCDLETCAVEIAKDSAEVLKKCIITPLDEAMGRITRNKLATGDSHDAMLTVYKAARPIRQRTTNVRFLFGKRKGKGGGRGCDGD